MLEVPESVGKSIMFNVQTVTSSLSVGTEKVMIDVDKKSLLVKDLASLDWVKHVLRASYLPQ